LLEKTISSEHGINSFGDEIKNGRFPLKQAEVALHQDGSTMKRGGISFVMA